MDVVRLPLLEEKEFSNIPVLFSSILVSNCSFMFISLSAAWCKVGNLHRFYQKARYQKEKAEETAQTKAKQFRWGP